MNTEQVVEMIDAISEGKRYTLSIASDDDESNGKKSLAMRMGEGSILFYLRGPVSFAGEIDNPRTAREIAGALVAWANRKEGKIQETKQVEASLILRSEATRPSTADAIKLMSGRSTKTEWYAANVGRMTPETKSRNLRDLREILAEGNVTHTEQADITTAIQILRDNGAE